MQDSVNSECVMIIAVSHISRMVTVEINIRQHKKVFEFEHSFIQGIISVSQVHS